MESNDNGAYLKVQIRKFGHDDLDLDLMAEDASGSFLKGQ
jgi:hypothetical protein